MENTNSKHMQVKGRFLYDSNGEKIVIRGVENFFDLDLHGNGDIIPEIAKTGANCLRILFRWDPSGKTKHLPLEYLENLIKLTLQHGMIPHICMVCWGDNLNGEDRLKCYLDDNIKKILLKYEEYILVDANAESLEENDEVWAATCKKFITAFRDAGYRVPLYLMTRKQGRNLPCVLNKAEEVFQHDPLENCVFGWQAYWGKNDYYQKLYGMSLHEAVVRLKNLNYMVQLGILYFSDHFINKDDNPCIDIMDYKQVMKDAEENQLSWLWWDWHYTKGHYTNGAFFSQRVFNLTEDGKYGHWQEPFGAEVCVNSPYGIKNTSIRLKALQK